MNDPKLSILILTIPNRAAKLECLMGVLLPQVPIDNSVEIIVKEELPINQGGPTIGGNRNAALADAAGEYVSFVDDDDMVPEYYVEKILGAIEPKSLAAEAAVVGSMLIDPGCIVEVAEILDSFDFQHIANRRIFEALLAVYEKKYGVDAVMLRDELVKRDCLEEVGGVEYIAKVLDSVPSSANVAYYADILKRCSHPDVIGFKGHYILGGNKPDLFIHSMQYKEWLTVDGVHQRCPNHLNPVKREIALQVPYPEKNHGEDQDYSMALLPLLNTEVMIDDCIMYFYLK